MTEEIDVLIIDAKTKEVTRKKVIREVPAEKPIVEDTVAIADLIEIIKWYKTNIKEKSI